MVKKKSDKKKLCINETDKGIPIEWYVPDGLISPFATNMVVQGSENAVKVLFFEVKPPLQFDESQPTPSKVRADCVASVVITPDKIPLIIEVFQKQYDKHVLKK